MMPSIILDEIFNLQLRISEPAIEYISDQLDSFRCTISSVDDHDVAITIRFGRSMSGLPDVEGEIRIDRFDKTFEVVGYCDGTMLPIKGDWELVIEYLRQLTDPK
jgi:hypothetical protein